MSCHMIQKYDDIMARLKLLVNELYESLDIDIVHVENALSSMDHDSQRHFIVSRERLASNRYLSTAYRIKIDFILS